VNTTQQGEGKRKKILFAVREEKCHCGQGGKRKFVREKGILSKRNCNKYPDRENQGVRLGGAGRNGGKLKFVRKKEEVGEPGKGENPL